MFPSVVAVALTAVCVATGVLALARGAGIGGTPAGCAASRTESRATELLHVLMSVAMVAMAWGLAGGPGTVDGAAQIVVFGAFAAGFAVLAARRARGLRLVRSSHALMAAAMVWMVALMPSLMHAAPATASGAAAAPAAGGHGMHGMHGGDEMAAVPAATPMAAGSSVWVPATTVLAVVLVAAALAWGVRAVQAASPAHRALATLDAAPAEQREPASAAVATLTPPTGTAVAPPRPGPAALTASCHGLMSVAMAAMLVAML